MEGEEKGEEEGRGGRRKGEGVRKKKRVKITSFQILLSLSLSACVFTTSDEILLSEFGNEVGSI